MNFGIYSLSDGTFIAVVPRNAFRYEDEYTAELKALTDWLNEQFQSSTLKIVWKIVPEMAITEYEEADRRRRLRWGGKFSHYQAAMAFYLRFG